MSTMLLDNCVPVCTNEIQEGINNYGNNNIISAQSGLTKSSEKLAFECGLSLNSSILAYNA